MKRITGLFICASILLISSCQKEVNGDVNTNPGIIVDSTATGFKVRTYTESFTSAAGANFSTTYLLTYDAAGRIISLIDSSDNRNKFLYAYPSASLYTMDLYDSSGINIHENLYLNSVPMVDSTLQYNATDTSTEKSIFDAAGRLISLKEFDYTTAGGAQLYEQTDFAYDANGDLVTETTASGTVTTYTYSTALNTIDVGLIYLPKPKHLYSRMTTVDGGITTVVDYTYTFDSLHRVIAGQEVYDNGDVVSKSYTY